MESYYASTYTELKTYIDDQAFTEKVINITDNFAFEDVLEIPWGQTITIQSDPSRSEVFVLTPYLENDGLGGNIGRGLRHFSVTGDLTIENIILDGNKEASGERGGVEINGGASFTMGSGSTICHNQADQGGGVYVGYGETMFIMEAGSLIRHNNSLYSGGGVNSNGIFILNGGVISENEILYSGSGGGVYIKGDNYNDKALFVLNRGQIRDNKATLGGGVYIHSNGQLVMNGGAISDNKAASKGGGIYNSSEGFLAIEEGAICYNQALDEGAGIYIEEPSHDFYSDYITTTYATCFKKNKTMEPSFFTGVDGEFIRSANSSIRDYSVFNNADVNRKFGIPLTETFYDIFPDRQLARVVAQAFDAQPDEYTWEVELQSLTTLEAPKQNIQSLENIDHLINLSELNLDGNHIRDISPLYPLLQQNLKTDKLSIKNQILTLDSTRVGVLNNSKISDEEQTKLELTIDGGDGKSFGTTYFWYESGKNILTWDKDYYSGTIQQDSFKAPIEKIFIDKNLAQVIADRLNKRVTDLINLKELNLIQNLTAPNKNIKTLEGVQYLENISKLSLNQNQITDLSPLSNLDLTTLELDGNPGVELSGLSNIKTLVKLSLNDNGLTGIEPLTGLSNLEILSVQGNRLSTMTAINGFKYLMVLNLNDNQITDLTNVVFPKLTDLLLEGNNFSDLEKLPMIPGIEKLYLNNNGIASITPLASLTTLKILELNDNSAITTVADLGDLTELFSLELMGNKQIKDINTIKNIPNLWFLNYEE